MHLKYLLGSIARVGYWIPVSDLFLLFHGLRCRKIHLNGLTNLSINNPKKTYYFAYIERAFVAITLNGASPEEVNQIEGCAEPERRHGQPDQHALLKTRRELRREAVQGAIRILPKIKQKSILSFSPARRRSHDSPFS